MLFLAHLLGLVTGAVVGYSWRRGVLATARADLRCAETRRRQAEALLEEQYKYRDHERELHAKSERELRESFEALAEAIRGRRPTPPDRPLHLVPRPPTDEGKDD